jgi:Calx-beta domain
MRFNGQTGSFRGILSVVLLAAALTGCDGSSADSSSSAVTSSTAGTGTAMSSVALSSADYQVVPASSAVVTIYRTGPAAGTATVGYDTVNGSAISGTDYKQATGTVSWNDGDTTPRTIVVPVFGTATGKSFAISLSSIEGSASFGHPASAIINVVGSGTSTSGSASGSSSGGTTTASTGGSSGGTTTASTGGSSGGTTTASTGSSSGGTSASTSGSSSGTTTSASGSSSGSTIGTSTATLSWSPPTENSNGTALTNLVGYNIYYGTSTGAMINKIALNTVGVTNYVIQNMNSGTWYFAMTAVNGDGTESVTSSAVQVTL